MKDADERRGKGGDEILIRIIVLHTGECWYRMRGRMLKEEMEEEIATSPLDRLFLSEIEFRNVVVVILIYEINACHKLVYLYCSLMFFPQLIPSSHPVTFSHFSITCSLFDPSVQ